MAQTRKYLIFFSYIGSGFWGSQLQFNKKLPFVETLQYVLESGLKYVFNLEGERPIIVSLASRTDKGVHSLRAAAYAVLPLINLDFIKPPILVKRLNSYFSDSKSVRILEAYIVSDSFNFGKVKKEKTYLFRLGLLKKEFYDRNKVKIIPIIEDQRTYFFSSRKTFDLKRTQEACNLFVGVKDFGAVLGGSSKNVLPTVCNITSFEVEESQPLFPLDPLNHKYNFYHFICKGDKFLKYMVRRMVSLSIAVGLGILNLDDIQKLFDKPVRSSWPKKGIPLVSGCGLYLINIKFDFEDFIQNEEHNEQKNELILKNSN